MNTNNKIGLAVLAVIILAGAWMLRPKQAPINIFDSREAVKQLERNDQSVPPDEFVKRNISGLSAEAGFPEVLGGTFYVTKITAANGSGVVEYEDGHNAYTADFKYSIKKGLVTLTSFIVRQ